MSRHLLLLTGAVVAAALTACHSGEPPVHAGAIVAGDSYVALGDSYTAAPGIGPADGNDGCFRSLGNYPHLVADALGLDLTDNSCSGANTGSITGPGQSLTGVHLPPQLKDVDADTDLVTVGIGGNDGALYNLISTYCAQVAHDTRGGTPCVDLNSSLPEHEQVASKLAAMQKSLTSVLGAIAERAPDALVLVIGYPAIIPEHGACAELPVAEGDVPFLHDLNTGLNRAVSQAARASGATYVDTYDATVGHDICSNDPWIAGLNATNGKAAVWHPYATEQDKVASLIEDELRDAS